MTAVSPSPEEGRSPEGTSDDGPKEVHENLGPDFRETDWVRPDMVEAKAHLKRTTFGGGKRGCMATSIEDFNTLGVGVQLYFFLLKTFTFLFLGVTILYAPQLWLNSGGNGGHALSADKMASDPTGLIKYSLANQGYDPDTMGDGGCSCASVSFFSTVTNETVYKTEDCEPVEADGIDCRVDFETLDVAGEQLDAKFITYVLSGSQFFVAIAIMVSFISFGAKVKSIVEWQDDTTASPSDYTVMVRYLPPDVTPEEIRDWFSNLYDLSKPEPKEKRSLKYRHWGYSPAGVGIVYGIRMAVVFGIIAGPSAAAFFDGVVDVPHFPVLATVGTMLGVFGLTWLFVWGCKIGRGKPRPSMQQEWEQEYQELLHSKLANTKAGMCSGKKKSAVLPDIGPMDELSQLKRLEAQYAHIPRPDPQPISSVAIHGNAEYIGKWVADVSVAHPIGPLVMMLKSQTKLNTAVKIGRATIKKWQTLKVEHEAVKADPTSGCWKRFKAGRAARAAEASRKGAEKKYVNLNKKLERLKKAMIKGADPASMDKVDAAFVTFEHEESAYRCMDDFRNSKSGFARRWAPWELQFPHPRKKTATGKPVYYKLRCESAPEPANVLWENISLSDRERSIRGWITAIITIIMLLLSFAIIYVAQSQQKLAEKAIPDVTVCSEGLPAIFGGSYNASGAEWSFQRPEDPTASECPVGTDELSYDWYSEEADLPRLTTAAGGFKNRTKTVDGEVLPLIGCSVTGKYAINVLKTTNPNLLSFYASGLSQGYELGEASGCNEMCDSKCFDPSDTSPCYQLACFEPSWQDVGYGCTPYTQNTPIGCYCIAAFTAKTEEIGFMGAVSDLQNGPDSELCGTFIGNMANAYLLKIASAVGIIVINMVLEMVIQGMSDFERHLSISGKAGSLVIKQTLAKFLNTAMIGLIVNTGFSGTLPAFVEDLGLLQGDYEDFDKGWYVAVAAALTMTMVINTFVPVASAFAAGFVKKIVRRLGGGGAVTQAQLNTLYEGVPWQYEKQYAFILVFLFVTLFYMGGVPVLAALASLHFFLMWQMDKYLMLRSYKKPPTYDAQLANMLAGMLPIAFLMHLGTASYMLGNDQLLKTDAIHPMLSGFYGDTRGENPMWGLVGNRIVRGNVFPLVVLWAGFAALLIAYNTFGRLLLKVLAKVARTCGAKPEYSISHMKRQPPYTGTWVSEMTKDQIETYVDEESLESEDLKMGLVPYDTIEREVREDFDSMGIKEKCRNVVKVDMDAKIDVEFPGGQMGLHVDTASVGGYLMVDGVDDSSPAKTAGVVKGLVVYAVNEKLVPTGATMQAFVELVNKARGGAGGANPVTISFVKHTETWKAIANDSLSSYHLDANPDYTEVIELLAEAGFAEGKEARAAIAEAAEKGAAAEAALEAEREAKKNKGKKGAGAENEKGEGA